MSVVVVKKEEVLTIVKKKEVTIVYTKNCGKFVCEPHEPDDLGDAIRYTLKPRRVR